MSDTEQTSEAAPESEAEGALRPGHERRAKAAAKNKGARGVLLFLRDAVIIVVVAVLISTLIKTFLVRTFYIPSGSMENTLQVNDRILVNQLFPDVYGLSRGDVVVFKDPGGWLSSSPQKTETNPLGEAIDWTLTAIGLGAGDSDDHLVKRVIGLPGDHVECCDAFGRITINGESIDESAYLKLPSDTKRVSRDSFDVTVPEGSLWVMGDNRYNSQDSRAHGDTPGKGFVRIDDVVGKAFVVSWPFSRFAWLDNYSSVFAAVPEPTASATSQSSSESSGRSLSESSSAQGR